MYKAVLFHPEGDFVTDFTGNKTVQDVWEDLANMGSRWIFYPLAFVCTDKTIADTPEGLEWMKGRKITTVQKFFSQTWPNSKDEICEALSEGFMPFIYRVN